MNYLINRENFRQKDISEIGKLSPRAYFIPYSSKEKLCEQTVLTERYNSDKVLVLSGEWDFKYYEKDMLIPNSFYTERVQFDKVQVPSTWARTGYREPCYLNTRYEFDPTLYPEVPQDVPMGIYRKFVTVNDTSKVRIITFLGVMSSLDLYVNGKFVGYSEGSHNSAEFNITEFLVEGENEILAVVSKWSTGTYLECQDMFRENGIFRDVYITELENTYIYDYFANSIRSVKGKYNLNVCVDVIGDTKDYTVTCDLLDGENLVSSVTQNASGKTELPFGELSVKEWNAEEPCVYTLYITLKKGGETVSVIRQYIGFKTVEIKGNIFYFNDKPIKFKGVNHHDTDPENGYVLTLPQIESELKTMKEFNINSIRTSHYPPDPTLLTLADLMGFYIVDEADIETHGAFDCQKPGTPNLISNDISWASRYVDRVSRMYFRDRNHVSITMWSLGNEAGGWRCQDKCYDYLKEQGTPIPVHYEGVVRTKRFAYDVISEMYPFHDHFEKIGSKKEEAKFYDKPFFMCEYCHAMGVGPGGMEEYWESIYAHDNLMGGCIWEWADHSVYHGKDDSKYKFKYTYGGDHGEKKHDSNFCVDGMMYPDKTPHTGAFVIKAVYRPVRSRHVSGKVFEFTNTNRFKNSNYLKVVWTQLVNGKKVKTGELNLDIEPMQKKTYEIPYDVFSATDDCHVNIAYFDGDTRVSLEQAVLNDVKKFAPQSSGVGIVTSSLNNDILTVDFDGGHVAFNKQTGEMTEYVKNGKNYLNTNPADGKKGFAPNITRASLDNDAMGFPKLWTVAGVKDAKTVVKSFSFADKSYYTVVAVTYSVKKSFRKLFDANIVYVIHSDGLVCVESTLQKSIFGPLELQRFGVTVELPKEFSHIEFYGRGSDEKMENLCDLRDHATIGIYRTTVQEMHEPYIMPQDNGNCGGVKYLKLFNDKGEAFTVYGEPKFSFSAHNYTQKSLDSAKHQEEIEYADTTVLSVDGFMRGTGTNTCGPDTLEKYRVKTDKPLKFRFSFKAEKI